MMGGGSMMLLQVSGLKKEFGGVTVLSDVTFHLAAGERVGLIGANGSGKSTLMKIITGHLVADDGSVSRLTPGLVIGFVPQSNQFDLELPLAAQLDGIPASDLARLRLGPDLLSRPAGTLSGGQLMRAALIRALAQRTDALLLDEPTNHLDSDGLDWLQAALTAYRGAVLVVSHDRYFLDQTVSRVIELAGGRAQEYAGNYSAYARQKQAERERAEDEYRVYRRDKAHLVAAVARQREWANRVHTQKLPRELKATKAFNESKAKAHMQVAKSMERRLERMRVDKPRAVPVIDFAIRGGAAAGANLALATDLGFTYDGKHWLFRHAGFYLQRGERVAVVGPNGSGKTTLLRLLMGELQPSEGTLYRPSLRTACLSQHVDDLNPDNTVLAEAAGNVALDQPVVRTLLGCLLFSGDAVLKRVAVLSGGERLRLAVAKILLSEPDLLILDEPTNNADLPSREQIEEALNAFTGTLVVVSHDRYLLSRLATRVFAIADGALHVYSGGYGDYRRRLAGDGHGNVARSQERILLLETRLAQLSAALVDPPTGERETLAAEFIRVSRELAALKRCSRGQGLDVR